MRSLLSCLAVAGCSSPASPPPAAPTTPVAAIDAAAPAADAAPQVPDELAHAPAWIFRYATAERTETWTLRHHGDGALVTVEGAQGTTRYLGTAADGASLALAVTSGPNQLALDCKRQKRGVGATCNDPKAKPLDVLDCYHPDFGAPMTFGAAPGIEYTDACKGYRLIAK
ncbi:MAG: hypothetical protein KF773_23875 [Deltaproteobacteria bacterium]|nr:hypothetical protein [Deltaproteobacteria bacterium]